MDAIIHTTPMTEPVHEADIVEEEKENPADAVMDKPFNPTLIDIKTRSLTLDLLIKRLSAQPPEIDLFPDFQRHDDLWDDRKQSLLIESILINFPLPVFYFDGSDDNQWAVVDGLQRLSTLRNFVVQKKLRLTGLEFLTHLEGVGYDDLPRPMQRRIEETQVVAYIINPGTPDEVKYNIFKRINTGGLVLNNQEIRHALNQGTPSRFVADLATTNEFKIATGGRIRSERMLDREFVTRFLAFYTYGHTGYKPDLDTFLNQAMADVARLSDHEREKIKNDFIESMKLAWEVFDEWAFRKMDTLDKPYRYKPINKALFEVWSVEFARLLPDDRRKLGDKKQEVRESFVSLITSDPKFVDAVTTSTGNRGKVDYRYIMIKQLLSAVLQHD